MGRTLAAFTVLIVVTVGGYSYYRLKPKILTESRSPRNGDTLVRIVETPHQDLITLVAYDSCTYRFECCWPRRNYLWSAVSYAGESFFVSRARIEWKDDNTAIAFLDDVPFYVLKDREWTRYGKNSRVDP